MVHYDGASGARIAATPSAPTGETEHGRCLPFGLVGARRIGGRRADDRPVDVDQSECFGEGRADLRPSGAAAGALPRLHRLGLEGLWRGACFQRAEDPGACRALCLIGRMRVLCRPETVAAGEKLMRVIVDAYRAPKRTMNELHDLMTAGEGIDPLKEFSLAARHEVEIARSTRF